LQLTCFVDACALGRTEKNAGTTGLEPAAPNEAHNELELRVQERTKELSERNEQVRELSVKLLRLQDEERRRLARELHDSTGQMLAAMKIALDETLVEVTGNKAASLVRQSIEINDEMSRQLRTMSYLLHPPLLDEAGLPSALRWYTDGFTARSGIDVDLQVSTGFDRLPQELETALFRVVQECLTNIHRHSGSSSAKIQLTRTTLGVDAEISDKGRGIAPDRMRVGKIVSGVGKMAWRNACGSLAAA
jgi:signal transduction histidine kinase